MKVRVSKILTLLVLILLVGFTILLLWPDGHLPWTKHSPRVYEALNFSNLRSLSPLVSKAKIAKNNEPWTWELLAKMDEAPSFFESKNYEFPDKIPFIIHEKPKGVLRIVISSNNPDKYHMLWGITEDGAVIKYMPRENLRLNKD